MLLQLQFLCSLWIRLIKLLGFFFISCFLILLCIFGRKLISICSIFCVRLGLLVVWWSVSCQLSVIFGLKINLVGFGVIRCVVMLVSGLQCSNRLCNFFFFIGLVRQLFMFVLSNFFFCLVIVCVVMVIIGVCC